MLRGPLVLIRRDGSTAEERREVRQKRGREKLFVQRTNENVLKRHQAFGGRIEEGKKKEE